MPNGGYPKHLLVAFRGSELRLHARGTSVELLQYVPALPGSADRPQPVPLSTLTREQVGALLYHLLYWNGSIGADLRESLSHGSLPIQPQFAVSNCLYDY